MEPENTTASSYTNVTGQTSLTSLSLSTEVPRFLGVVIVLINVITVVTFVGVRALRTASNLLVVSLAITDILLGIMPVGIEPLLKALPTKNLCLVKQLWPYTLGLASALHQLVIAADRYVYIVHPFFYTRLVSRARVKVTIGSVWMIAFLVNAMPVFFNSYKEVDPCARQVQLELIADCVNSSSILCASILSISLYALISRTALARLRSCMRQVEPYFLGTFLPPELDNSQSERGEAKMLDATQWVGTLLHRQTATAKSTIDDAIKEAHGPQLHRQSCEQDEQEKNVCSTEPLSPQKSEAMAKDTKTETTATASTRKMEESAQSPQVVTAIPKTMETGKPVCSKEVHEEAKIESCSTKLASWDSDLCCSFRRAYHARRELQHRPGYQNAKLEAATATPSTQMKACTGAISKKPLVTTEVGLTEMETALDSSKGGTTEGNIPQEPETTTAASLKKNMRTPVADGETLEAIETAELRKMESAAYFSIEKTGESKDAHNKPERKETVHYTEFFEEVETCTKNHDADLNYGAATTTTMQPPNKHDSPEVPGQRQDVCFQGSGDFLQQTNSKSIATENPTRQQGVRMRRCRVCRQPTNITQSAAAENLKRRQGGRLRRGGIFRQALRAVKMSFAVCAAFFFCYGLFIVCAFVKPVFPVPTVVLNASKTMVFLNSGVNFFIYVFMNQAFRKAIQKLFAKMCLKWSTRCRYSE